MTKNFELSITQNLNVNFHSPTAYRASIGTTDAETTDRIEQIGPVFNNVWSGSGVFATRKLALEAARASIGKCTLLLWDNDDNVYIYAANEPFPHSVDGKRPTAIARHTAAPGAVVKED